MLEVASFSNRPNERKASLQVYNLEPLTVRTASKDIGPWASALMYNLPHTLLQVWLMLFVLEFVISALGFYSGCAS